jgi:hypothetical protein
MGKLMGQIASNCVKLRQINHPDLGNIFPVGTPRPVGYVIPDLCISHFPFLGNGTMARGVFETQ